MKKHFIRLVLVFALVLAGAGVGFAGNGKGQGDGTGPIHDITVGVPFTSMGTVTDCSQGNGLTLSVSGQSVQIFGIGPVSYWDSLGVDYPDVGDALTVEGYSVDIDGTVRNIAMKITNGGKTIELRDADTGQPLWRGINKKK